MSTKRLAADAMFLTLALVVSYIEVLIPIPVGIPGIKLGLANGVIMVLLFFTTWIRTLEISVIRVVLAGFLFGNPMTIVYSLAGGILSLIVMGLLKKIEGFSPVGISVGGGVAHNIGQLSVAVILMENTKIYYYAPVLLITGTIAGIILGIILHKYVIFTTEVDLIMFGRQIYLPSYVYSILLTIAFSILVNAFVYFQLKKIDMVESLKSTE